MYFQRDFNGKTLIETKEEFAKDCNLEERVLHRLEATVEESQRCGLGGGVPGGGSRCGGCCCAISLETLCNTEDFSS